MTRLKLKSLHKKVLIAIAAIASIGAMAVFVEFAGRAFVSSAYDHGSTATLSGPQATNVSSAAPKAPEFAMHGTPRPLPNIAFADGDNRARTLADFRGKTVLLNLWATWCAPCRKEMPTLDRLQMKLGGSDFEVVALSIDRAGVDAVRKFYGEIEIMRLAVYIDTGGKAARDLGIVGIPVTLLIDRTGLELGRLVGPAEWDAPEMVGFLKSAIADRRGARGPAGDPGPRLQRRMAEPSSDRSDVAGFRTSLNGEGQ